MESLGRRYEKVQGSNFISKMSSFNLKTLYITIVELCKLFMVLDL